MGVALSKFFPGIAAYFNGERDINSYNWRFFIVEKFSQPVFTKLTEEDKAWLRAYVSDGDKAIVIAQSVEAELTQFKSDNSKLYLDYCREVLEASKKDSKKNWIFNNLASPSLETLINKRIGLTDGSEIRKYIIDGILSQNLERVNDPRNSMDFQVNTAIKELIKKLEAKIKDNAVIDMDEKQTASVNFERMDQEFEDQELYLKIAKDIQALNVKLIKKPYLFCPSLSKIARKLMRRQSEFADYIKVIEDKYKINFDNVTDEQRAVFNDSEKKFVINYENSLTNLEDFLFEKVNNQNLLYASKQTQYFNFRTQFPDSTRPIPTISAIVDARILHPFYLLEACSGGIARLTCAGVNKIIDKNSTIGTLVKSVTAGAFIIGETIFYGLSKVTSRSGLGEITDALFSHNQVFKINQPPASRPASPIPLSRPSTGKSLSRPLSALHKTGNESSRPATAQSRYKRNIENREMNACKSNQASPTGMVTSPGKIKIATSATLFPPRGTIEVEAMSTPPDLKIIDYNEGLEVDKQFKG